MSNDVSHFDVSEDETHFLGNGVGVAVSVEHNLVFKAALSKSRGKWFLQLNKVLKAESFDWYIALDFIIDMTIVEMAGVKASVDDLEIVVLRLIFGSVLELEPNAVPHAVSQSDLIFVKLKTLQGPDVFIA